MTTIVIAKPKPDVQPHWQVFGVYDGPDDRFTFGLFETDDPQEAEKRAKEMMEKYGADHLSRTQMTRFPAEVAVVCHICHATTTLEQAIEGGWAPSYWRGEQEIGEPTCAECLTKYLRFNEEMGDFELPDEQPGQEQN